MPSSVFGVMFYSYQHAGLLTGVPCWATSPPVMHWQVLVYARSITNHLGFEPGVTWLSGVTAQLCAMGCSVKVHKERQRKGSQVVSNQSKFSLSGGGRPGHQPVLCESLDQDVAGGGHWWRSCRALVSRAGRERSERVPLPGPLLEKQKPLQSQGQRAVLEELEGQYGVSSYRAG